MWQSAGSDIERQYSSNASDRCNARTRVVLSIEFIAAWERSLPTEWGKLRLILNRRCRRSSHFPRAVPTTETPAVTTPASATTTTPATGAVVPFTLSWLQEFIYTDRLYEKKRKLRWVTWNWGRRKRFMDLSLEQEKSFECYTDLLGTFIPFWVLFLLILVRTLPPYSQMSNTLLEKGAIRRLCVW